MNKYIIDRNERADMRVRNFKWQCGEDNSVLLEWNWPADRDVRLMLVFELDGDADADAEKLIEQGFPHTIVSRELSSKFSAAAEAEKNRYAICPAMFGCKKQIIALCPGMATDIIYRKTKISVHITEHPFLLSRYKKVSWSIKTDGEADTVKVLKYAVCEGGIILNTYPLDEGILTGDASICLEKQKEIKFLAAEGYEHLLRLDTDRSVYSGRQSN